MDNHEHYQEFLDLIENLKTEKDIKVILLKITKELATQNYVILEKLEKIQESKL